jgi:hypothetical protein
MKPKRNKGLEQQPSTEPATMPRQGSIPLMLNRETLIQGFIFSEILGKPKAKRKRR